MTTSAVPRYLIQNKNGIYFDVFNRRENAIKACIKFAFEYPGNIFCVIKKVNFKDKEIFSFGLNHQFDLADIRYMYDGIVKISQEKLEKTKYWRKDGY